VAESSPMERYARRVALDAAVARRRSLTRRLGGPLVWKYLQVVPSVFTARGEFTAFKLLVSVEEAIDRLSGSADLTLDSASERFADLHLTDVCVLQIFVYNRKILANCIFDIVQGFGLGGPLRPATWQAGHRDTVSFVRRVNRDFVLHEKPPATCYAVLTSRNEY
jgi:hypothetical protein